VKDQKRAEKEAKEAEKLRKKEEKKALKEKKKMEKLGLPTGADAEREGAREELSKLEAEVGLYKLHAVSTRVYSVYMCLQVELSVYACLQVDP
jgi:ribose 5-phosphate isomerase